MKDPRTILSTEDPLGGRIPAESEAIDLGLPFLVASWSVGTSSVEVGDRFAW